MSLKFQKTHIQNVLSIMNLHFESLSSFKKIIPVYNVTKTMSQGWIFVCIYGVGVQFDRILPTTTFLAPTPFQDYFYKFHSVHSGVSGQSSGKTSCDIFLVTKWENAL